MLELRHSFNLIATISGMLSVKYNRSSTDDDSCDQKDGSPESAESMVSNNSTMGDIPHETSQLNFHPPPISSQLWHIYTLAHASIQNLGHWSCN